LANAIGNQVKQLDPTKRVLYVSANTFKLQYQDAVTSNHIPDFLNFYQQIDVLIVDDIQYFSRLQGTQDSFFHIFNHLQLSHKQLILTSDRSPLELKDIDDRLLTRFKWGLSAEITRPDYALRKSILLSKMSRDGVVLSDEIVDFIATNVCDSVRDLEGVVASLLAYSTLINRDIDMLLAEQVVGRIVKVKPREIQPADVLSAVSEHFNVQEKAILSQVRTKEIMQARHIAMFLAKRLTTSSLSEIGAFMGHRTHATVLHSLNLIQDQIKIDPILRHRIDQIESVLMR
jgi:chromosomal replication initiator protein